MPMTDREAIVSGTVVQTRDELVIDDGDSTVVLRSLEAVDADRPEFELGDSVSARGEFDVDAASEFERGEIVLHVTALSWC